MDLFYQGGDTEERLVAAAHRAAESILRSPKYLKRAVAEELLALLSPHALWGLCLVLAGWFLASVISGPIGLGVNVLLLAYGLWDLWERIEELYGLLKEWLWGFYSATTEAQLDKAGEHFAKALSKGGVTILELVLTHRAYRYASGKLVEKFPVPERLKQRVKEEQQRVTETEAEQRKQGERKQSAPEAKRSRTTELEPNPREQRLLRKLKELRGTLTVHGTKELGRDLGDKLPSVDGGTVALVGILTLATAGLVALGVAAAHEKEKSR